LEFVKNLSAELPENALRFRLNNPEVLMSVRSGVTLLSTSVILLASIACSGPSGGLTSPSAVVIDSSSQSAARPNDRCANVAAEGQTALVPVGNSFGAAPAPMTLAGITGTLSSVVIFGPDATQPPPEHGAWHVTLTHTFTSPQGTFVTEDRAVCAPAGSDPNVCRVNDVLEVVSGTGVFANAGGQLQNHGIIDQNTFTLTFSLRGRVCGDGL
jgi:hypothetical protein